MLRWGCVLFALVACAAGDDWLPISGVKTTYKILKAGPDNAPVVAVGDTVTVHATGIVAQTQKKFWSTKDKGQKPFTYTAGGGVIKGWDMGARGMRIGEVRALRIPADEGYGASGFPSWGIPKNADLNFELEVLSIEGKAVKLAGQGQELGLDLGGAARVQCQLTTGPVTIEVHPEWAPIGAARFLDMVSSGYLDGAALFRAIPDFLCQFGISKDATLRSEFTAKGKIKDDPLRPDIPIGLGTMAFAGSGKDSRTTQVWFAFSDKDKGLGTRPWETPFGQVVGQESLEAVLRINTEYGDTVDQHKIWSGYKYLEDNFPRLSYIQTCVVQDAAKPVPKPVPAPPPPPPSPELRGAAAASEHFLVAEAADPAELADERPLGLQEGVWAFGGLLVLAFCYRRCRAVAGESEAGKLH